MFLRQKAATASCTRGGNACATGLRNATARAVKGNVPPWQQAHSDERFCRVFIPWQALRCQTKRHPAAGFAHVGLKAVRSAVRHHRPRGAIGTVAQHLIQHRLHIFKHIILFIRLVALVAQFWRSLVPRRIGRRFIIVVLLLRIRRHILRQRNTSRKDENKHCEKTAFHGILLLIGLLHMALRPGALGHPADALSRRRSGDRPAVALRAPPNGMRSPP